MYIPTDSTSITVVKSCSETYAVLIFSEKGQVMLLGDFKARVCRSVEEDDVIGMFRVVVALPQSIMSTTSLFSTPFTMLFHSLNTLFTP